MAYKAGATAHSTTGNPIIQYGVIRWIIDGVKLNGRLDRINKELAIQDALEFEQAVKAAARQAKQDVRDVKAMHKVLSRTVKAL